MAGVPEVFRIKEQDGLRVVRRFSSGLTNAAFNLFVHVLSRGFPCYRLDLNGF